MKEFLEILKVILYGIIEGITEWLPVSSTGHIKLFNAFCPLNLSESFQSMLDYVVQLFAILAVVVLFWKKLFPLKKETSTSSEEESEGKKAKIVWDKNILLLWAKVIVACLPALVAFFVDKAFENLDKKAETAVIASTLILYGILFIVVETLLKNKTPKTNSTDEITFRDAFLVGCFQILASVPGTSRSGVTILGALLIGLSRPAATEFSFFLAIPTMVGTSAYKILMFLLDGATVSQTEVWALVVACSVAFVVSLLAISFLTSFVKKHDFKPFGYYRILLGVVVLVLLFALPNF